MINDSSNPNPKPQTSMQAPSFGRMPIKGSQTCKGLKGQGMGFRVKGSFFLGKWV